MIPMAKPILGEEEIDAVSAVLRSGQLVQGRLVEEFEGQFAAAVGATHAVAVANGTAALHVALLAHGIGPGDEVITTPFSFIATANAIQYTGAKPVFVDIQADDYNIDPRRIEEKITARTRAILPVHLFGNPADLPAIREIAARHQLVVIEDAAQAHGAEIAGCKIGSVGTACFSLYATKNLTTAEGGMVTTDDARVARRIRLLRSHGQEERYQHEVLGFNYRLTEIQAAIGLVQIRRLEELTRRRIAHATYLNARLAGTGVMTPVTRPGVRHVYHQYTIRIPGDRDRLARGLQVAGIGTSVHYPRPIHQQKVYRDLGYTDSLPVAEQTSREVLSLPVHPSLTPAELDRIASEVSRLVATLVSGVP